MSSPTPLKFLMPGYFALVMGLSGLTLAWHRAHVALGEMAEGIALVLGLLSALVFGVLLVASWLRWQRYPVALAEDLKHPIRHGFIAALPISLLLLATVGVALGGTAQPLGPVWNVLWWAGSLTQLWATVWVLGRWLSPPAAAMPGPTGAATGQQLLWPSVTPVLLIPVVGNVVVPLAGLPLGHDLWSALQFGIGAFLWPVVLALILARRIAHSPLPDRILASWFITIAPPAVIGVVLTQWQAPLPVVLAFWGVALFFLLWVATIVRRIAGQPFNISFWAFSFPLAAFTVLTLRVAELSGSTALQTAGVLMLAITSIAILWLGFATVRGLQDGSLLAPEPVANIQPVSSAA